MADIRIKELTELTELTDNDYFVVDNSASGGETKKYRATRVTEMIDAVAEEIEEKITPSIDTALALGTASGSIASFTDGSTLPMKKLEVAIEPQQDLHGYDAPWVGGAGKNKLQVTATSQTIAGVTITVKDDGTFIANGTATQNISLQLSRKSVSDTPLPEGQLIMTGCPSGGSTSSYYLTCWRTNSGNANDVGNGISFSYQSDWDFVVSLVITSGTTCNNLTFKPMIRLASVADATFAPYSNICPISGWDEVNVTRCGKNLSKSQTNNSVLCSAKKGVTYTLSYEGNVGANIKKNTNSGEVVIWGPQLPLTFTADEDFNIFLNAWSANISNIQVEVGNKATTYEPYNGQTYNIQFKDGDNPLTVYGGSLDVVSGVLTITHGSFRVGDVDWTRYSTEGKHKFYTTPSNIKNGTNITINGARSTIYKLVNFASLTNNNNINCFSDSANTIGRISVYDQDYINSTAEEFKAGRADVMFTYELATPITIQLTPTEVKSLLGSNNVWCDCGEIIDCEYKRDATAIINSLIARIEALENQ